MRVLYSVFSFVFQVLNSVAVAQAAIENVYMNECGGVPIKLYFQKWAEDWIWFPGPDSLLVTAQDPALSLPFSIERLC